MKRSKLLALSAITLLGFSACQKPELESELTSGATHTVTFVAGAPETKTTVDISDGTTAKFAWTEYDKSRFTVYENRAAAKFLNDVMSGIASGNKTAQKVNIPQGAYTSVCQNQQINLSGITTIEGNSVEVAPQEALIIVK